MQSLLIRNRPSDDFGESDEDGRVPKELVGEAQKNPFKGWNAGMLQGFHSFLLSEHFQMGGLLGGCCHTQPPYRNHMKIKTTFVFLF